ncbi:hypothetical protein DFH28DRAFT_951369 [Melampsora americana]|nr:hypothetical protein DFH28DRAFT_951369 [Melampsora americana]
MQLYSSLLLILATCAVVSSLYMPRQFASTPRQGESGRNLVRPHVYSLGTPTSVEPRSIPSARVVTYRGHQTGPSRAQPSSLSPARAQPSAQSLVRTRST